MSLSDCIQYAVDNNPQIRVAQLQVADADWQIKENKAIGYPQLSGSIGYQYFIQRPGIPASALCFPGAGDEKIAFNAYHSLTPSLAWNQLLFSNSYLVGLKAARYYREYVQQQLAVAQQTLRNQVVDSYLPALLIADNLGILDKNISNLEKLLSETKATTQAGFMEQLDVDRLDLSLSSLRAERDNLARQREIVVNALKFTMGMPVKQDLVLADDVQKLMTQFASVDLTSDVNFSNRPEYLQLLKGRELSAIQVELTNKPWMPTVAAFVQYQPGFQGGFGNDTKWFFIPSAIAGLSVNVPIWDGGGTKAKRERAIIGVQNIDAQKQLLENAITLEVENARKQYLNASERVKSQQKNLDLAQRIHQTTQTKYKAGVGSSFELVSTEQQLYTAQQGLMQAQYDLLAARVALKKALGLN
ncbi:MAG: TolC family protein [Saprospiraceae bacterium]|nr:TolC family protein [Saprospiraceae bacterium]